MRKISLTFVDRVCFGNTDNLMTKDSKLRQVYIIKIIVFSCYNFDRCDTVLKSLFTIYSEFYNKEEDSSALTYGMVAVVMVIALVLLTVVLLLRFKYGLCRKQEKYRIHKGQGNKF